MPPSVQLALRRWFESQASETDLWVLDQWFHFINPEGAD